MKRAMLFLLLTFSISYSQEILNPKSLTGINFNSSTFNRDFIKTNFTYGWNWSSPGVKLDNALNINAHHNQYLNGSNNSEKFDNTKYKQNYGFYVNITQLAERKNPYPFVGFGQYFEPSLDVDTTNNFIPNSEAEPGAVFGFMYKNTINSLGSNTFFSQIIGSGSNTYSSSIGCFRLDKNKISNTSATILKDIWKKNILTNFSKNISSGDDAILYTNAATYTNYTGVTQHISINLRAIENFSDDVLDNTEILKIRIPYRKITYASGSSSTVADYIKFSKIPQVSATFTNDIVQIYGSNTIGGLIDYRGMARKLATNSNTDKTEFIITKGMMKTANNNNSGTFITLTAEFICDDDIFAGHNPVLYYGKLGGEESFIDNIDMEISYSGTISTDINWVKIETPNLEDIYRGKNDYLLHDQIVKLANDIGGTNTANARIVRFYFDDELLPCQYEQHRYLNNLVDKLIISETGILGNNPYSSFSGNIIPHFFKATLQDNFYNGNTHYNSSIISNPFVKRAIIGIPGKAYDASPKTLEYSTGYLGMYEDRIHWGYNFNSVIGSDSVNSLYETYFITPQGLAEIPISNPSSTFEKLTSDFFRSTLQSKDYSLYWNMYKQPSLYYSEKPYLSNMWTNPYLSLYNETNSEISTTYTTANTFWERRPSSGEEFRCTMGSELLRGSKGMFFWKKTPHEQVGVLPGCSTSFTQPPKDGEGMQNTFAESAFPEGINLVYDEGIGGDFIKESGDPHGYDLGFDKNFYDWNKMDLPVGRYYIGLTSVRAEMYKYSNFIFAHESEFINMRLQAWKSKGFIDMGHQHPSYDHDIMNDYVNTSGITTKKLYTKNNDGDYFVNTVEEPTDSTFYEISLLNAKNVPAGNIMYIAVSNKRTDPLILNKNLSSSTTYSQLQFYSTAEFDRAVTTKNPTKDLFGTSHTFSWWQDMWWKRGGCRQIKIPMTFKYKNASGVDGYALLKVSEMKGYEFYVNELCSNTIMNSNTLSLSESEELTNYLYPKFEKIIGQDGVITANFLPGEMKIFKIQILPPAELKGKLDNINQNKMVSMPVYSSGSMTDKVIHYTTYYDVDNNGKKRVYLAMSQATNQSAVNANITWFPSFEISDNALLYSPMSRVVNNYSSTFYDSYHPTITVRNDGDNHKLFIAYSLKHPAPTVGYDAISIMETVYDINTVSMYASRSYNKEIAYVFTDGNDYGTPTVNSAKDVVFYAWSGIDYFTLKPSIFYSYKLPNQNGINTVKYIRNQNNLFPDCSNSSKFLHPSLNTYSTTYTKNGFTNYATLVWEQSACSNSGTINESNEIFMTNLFYINSSGSFSYFLPTFNFYSNYASMLDFYSSNNIVKFKQGKYNYVPSTYQNLLLNESNNLLNISDYIVFESNNFLKDIKLIPIYTTNSIWDLGGGLTLKYLSNRWLGGFKSLNNPTIKQPSIINNSFGLNSKINLNFNMNYDSYQYNLNDGTYLGYNRNDFNIAYSNKLAYNLSLIAQNNTQNHLSASPFLNYDATIYRNRRIYETGKDFRTLMTSARYFYKKNANDIEVQGFFGYKTDTTKFYIGDIYKDNNDLEMILPFNFILDTINGNRNLYNNNDTIFSDWFNVNTISELDFKLYGRNISNSLLYLERQDSLSIFPINVTTLSNDTLCSQINIMLINGNNHSYRFVMRRIDTLGIFDEFVAINGIEVADTVYFKSNHSNIKIIDLSGYTTMSEGNQLILNITPNPAENEAYAIAYIPSNHLIDRQRYENKLVLSLYNSIGVLIKEVESVSGETVKFDLRELGNGNYFVKVREKAETYYELCKPTQKSLLIKR